MPSLLRPITTLALLLPLLLLLAPHPARAADPIVSITRFPHLPANFFYFDDTPTVLVHDPEDGAIRLSSDEGASWAWVDDIPRGQAMRLVAHPHDNTMAFVLGRQRTHWVTRDRGQTWQAWKMDRDPSFSSENVLSFHAEQKDWILMQTTVCEDTGSGPWGSGRTCWDETFYTQDAFRSAPTLLLGQTSTCMFARSTPAFSHAPESLVFCVAFDPASRPSAGGHSLKESRLYSSETWFADREGTRFVDLGIGKKAQGVIALGVVSKFMVCALKVYDGLGARADRAAPGKGRQGGDPMHLYVSTDGESWRLAKFPHSVMPNLRENAYTVVESTTHSMAVDVLTEPGSNIGTLFVSSAEGEFFVQALTDTNRNDYGIVDYEGLTGLEGVALANVVANKEEVVNWGEEKKLKTMMTYDDGSSWRYLKPPAKQLNGDDWACDVSAGLSECSLHLHSVSDPHNFGKVFSSTAPGFVMGVGSVSGSLQPYEDCDTFISSDAGLTWNVVRNEPHKYEFGDQGSLLVAINDVEATDHVIYSYDFGQTWNELDLGVTIRALLLTTIPDSTSQKFLLLGTLNRGDSTKEGRYATVFMDFAALQNRKCTDKDFEQWYARSEEGKECLMGHKQWYRRRKPSAECYVGDKFKDPVAKEENCACTDDDYECDFNFVRQDGECVPAGLEPVPPGSCEKDGDTFLGSSGYRKIPGNTCVAKSGRAKDDKIEKSCELAKPEPGQASHVVHDFEASVSLHSYFPQSQTVLLQLDDASVWQSSNEGFTWKRLYESDTFLGVIMHSFANERAYLITKSRKVYYTTDTGSSWSSFNTPSEPNVFGAPILDFHPTRPDWLIFTGSSDCSSAFSEKCRSISYYTTNHGRNWKPLEEYVRSCSWARDTRLKIDEREIICESYKNKRGSQRSPDYNPMELIAGQNFYSKKIPLFSSIVGWATFSEYLVVAQLNEGEGTLSLQVSLDGLHFAEGQFPPSMRIENRAYTILESSTDAVFLHVTMNSAQGNEWGSIFKSNSNGTYYGLSVEHVNRNSAGYVDFEKGQKLGLDGIAVINVVANPDDASVSGQKRLQTRITHNDGGTWKPLNIPKQDSLGRSYDCRSTACALHIHGYTERRDPKATYSSPSAVGLMMAVGNVGEELAPYTDSDTFLTRDGGFTWEEIHKDAHMWEFGDSGSILVICNDEGPTDHVLFSTDEGLSWTEYSFDQMIRVKSIQTVPSDTSRKFMLIGNRPGQDGKSMIVHLDLSQVSTRKCKLSVDDPNHDDFELWSPSEVRDDVCLFGRQTLYHRRLRDKDCYIGETISQPRTIVRNCTCTASDFECEFNHYRNARGDCVLVDGAAPLSSDTSYEQCDGYEEHWYERTAYRKIPYSSCEYGDRPDRGKQHTCPYTYSPGGHGVFFWGSVIILPFACATLVAWWFYNQQGGGSIRLGEHRAFGGSSGTLSTLASVPYFLLGVASVGVAWISERIPFLQGLFGGNSPYRQLPIDDDAEIINQFEDD